MTAPLPPGSIEHVPKRVELIMQKAIILNAIVLVVVLEADLGPHRNIGWFRVLRPFVTSAAAVALFMQTVTTTGTGLTIEIALAAAGILLGLLATATMTVYRNPTTRKPTSRAGVGYALVWIVIIGARTAFSYGSVHWFGPSLHRWMAQHAVSTNAITDALLFMAIAMILTRSIALAVRASHLGTAGTGNLDAPSAETVR
jgi:hypothetical protein